MKVGRIMPLSRPGKRVTSYRRSSDGVSVRRAWAGALLISVLLTLGVPGSVMGQGPWIVGKDVIATNYGSAYDKLSPYQASYGTGVGSCGFGDLDKGRWPYWSVAALATSNPLYIKGPLQFCGQCLEVQCVDAPGYPFAGRCYPGSNTNSIVVMITDSCPECGTQHMDIQALTFAKLAPMAIGRINVRYRAVDCQPPTGEGMTLSVMNGASGKGFFKFTVQSVAGSGGIKAVQIAGAVSGNRRGAGPEWISAVPSANSSTTAPEARATVTSTGPIKSPRRSLSVSEADTSSEDDRHSGSGSSSGSGSGRGDISAVVTPASRRLRGIPDIPDVSRVQKTIKDLLTSSRLSAGSDNQRQTAAEKYALDGPYLRNTYGGAWQIDQMPTPPLSFQFIGANGQEVSTTSVVTAAQLAITPVQPVSAQFQTTGAGAKGPGALGSGQYGQASPQCPLGSFYDMTTGSVPACQKCVGFIWNRDPDLGCSPPLQNPDQKFFCSSLPVKAIALDRSSRDNCLDPDATVHMVRVMQFKAQKLKFHYWDATTSFALRANGKTILKATKFALGGGGVYFTFPDPDRSLKALMATRTLPADGLYIEGSVKIDNFGLSCVSSSPVATMKMCGMKTSPSPSTGAPPNRNAPTIAAARSPRPTRKITYKTPSVPGRWG